MGEDERELGIGIFGKVMGADAASVRRHLASDDFGKECTAWTTDFEFGQIWSRAGLDRRQRSCIALAMLIALRQAEEIKAHVRIALTNGLTVEEIEEVLYMAVPYVGLPAANTARRAMREALKDMGK